MMPHWTVFLLLTAGAAMVVQNLLMAKITGSVSTVLIALVINSAVGLVFLSLLLLRQTGLGGVSEILGTFRLWFVIPGLLGSFFVFVSIAGYLHVGAATTISLLVASQLIVGLAWDMARSDNLTLHAITTAILGAGLLICGVFVIVSRHQ